MGSILLYYCYRIAAGYINQYLFTQIIGYYLYRLLSIEITLFNKVYI